MTSTSISRAVLAVAGIALLWPGHGLADDPLPQAAEAALVRPLLPDWQPGPGPLSPHDRIEAVTAEQVEDWTLLTRFAWTGEAWRPKRFEFEHAPGRDDLAGHALR